MEKKRLVASISQFLGDELNFSNLSGDAKESLEVAIQCLESAYEIGPLDEALLPSKKLLEIFNEAVKVDQMGFAAGASDEIKIENRQEAERLKNEGNNLMKLEKFDEALDLYTKAIELDGTNAVYYCNRAASHSKLNNHNAALEDCKRAIRFDPNYSKAYGRMGLAYASMNNHFKAKECYQRAVELDPQNESYKNNLKIAEEKAAEAAAQSNPFAGMGGMGGMPDISTLLSNPALMNMATQLMSDPAMQNLMGGIMSSALGGGPPANPSGPSGGGGGGIETLLQAGQQIAAQMQAANPDLVEQLRQQMGGAPNPNQPPNSQDPREEPKDESRDRN